MSSPDRFRTLSRDHFDVAIVGAGIGGLVAGGILARRGKSVLIVDQHYVAGGNATIFRRKGYEFDVGIHYLGMCGEAGALPAVLRAAGAEDVTFRPMDPDGFDTLVFPDLHFRVPAGIDPYRDRLVHTFPEERAGIDRYMKVLRGVKRIMSASANPKRLPMALLKSALAVRWADSTLGAFLDTCTHDPALRAVLAGESGDYGQPPSRASFAMHAALMLHYLESGGYYPEGGGQVMADQIAASIERHGGKVLLITSVERIVIENGRAVGLELQNKHLGRQTVRADVVISNADLKATMLHLVGPEHLPSKLVRKTRGYEMSPGLGVVYVGLDVDLAAQGHPNTNYWIYPSYDQETGYRKTFANQFDDQPMAYVSIASVKDPLNPRIAPRGHTNLQVMGLAPSSPQAWGCPASAARHHHDYTNIPAYQERKQQYADRLIARARTVLGDALDQQHIDHLEVATPLTHARYTRATGGTSYGIALTPSQFLHRRPGAKTPIQNLYLCGASLRTGHGIMGAMMSGVFAAAEVAGKSVFADTTPRRSSRRRVERATPPQHPSPHDETASSARSEPVGARPDRARKRAAAP